MRRVLLVTKNTEPLLVGEFPWAELGAFHPRGLVCRPYLVRDIVITRLSDDIQPGLIGGPSENLNSHWRNIMRSHQHLKLHGYESADPGYGDGGLGRLEKGA
jgi:hypothetical protein